MIMGYKNLDLQRLHKDGKSINEITEALGWKRSQVVNAIGRGAKAGVLESRHTSKHYSAEEDDAIRAMRIEGRSAKEIADTFGRSESAIRGRLNALGLVKAKPWTPEKDAQLKSLYNTTPIAKIAGIFNITPAAVKARAGRLGLAKALKRWGTEEDEWLKSVYMSRPASELAAETGWNQETIKKHAKRLGLTGNGKKRGVSVARSRPVPRPRPAAEPEVAPLTARPLLEHKKDQCRFPYGERFNILFCCAPVWKDKPYCEAHAAVCYDFTKRAA